MVAWLQLKEWGKKNKNKIEKTSPHGIAKKKKEKEKEKKNEKKKNA